MVNHEKFRNYSIEQKKLHLAGFDLKGEAFCPFNTHTLYSIFAGQDAIALQEDQTQSRIEIKSQLVLPKNSIDWIINTIRNGFWKKPSDGGLPKDKHFADGEFDDEKLRIRRSMNAGAEGEMGFTITNLSRNSYISPSSRQSGTYTDKLLKDFIFPAFETL